MKLFKQIKGSNKAILIVIITQILNGTLYTQNELPSQQVIEEKNYAVINDKNPLKFNNESKHIEATIESKIEARTLTLTIPAARGQITDRFGRPFAQNKIAHYLALKFPYLKNSTRSQIIEYGQAKISKANLVLGIELKVSDENIWTHYSHRRWLNMPIPPLLSNEQANKIKILNDPELLLHSIYLRHYPNNSTAGHIIGFVGKTGPMPSGPITRNEPIWEFTEGRDGLELTMNNHLKGIPGRLQILYNEEGKIKNYIIDKQPIPGNNIVTTLDLDMQKIAEKTLSKSAKKGALVVIEISTGEIVAMASWPVYNPNIYIPSISQVDFDKLTNDPDKPLFPRAYRGAYPPASTFKALVALAALRSGKISQYSSIECPGFVWVGNGKFRNWHAGSEGPLNVISALKRSCNTWFIKTAIRTGANRIVNLADTFGFGKKTNIRLNGESGGLLPDNKYFKKKYGHKILQGNLANISIGQGELLATPLQIAKMMAVIAKGSAIRTIKIVKQIQNINNDVIDTIEKETSKYIDLSDENFLVVQRGLYEVVNGSNGTGSRSSNNYGTTAGKTGTAQWKKKTKQELAWFAGFIPYKVPEYAFAILYEGEPNEKVSGGKKAAPIIASYFNKLAHLRYKRLQEQKRIEDEKFKKLNFAQNKDQEESTSNESDEKTSKKKYTKKKPIYQTDLFNKNGGIKKHSENNHKKIHPNDIPAQKKPKKRRGLFYKFNRFLRNN